ncbi:MAG: hypothetical protein ABIQ31_11640 [Ferruginibacter sp.]
MKYKLIYVMFLAFATMNVAAQKKPDKNQKDIVKGLQDLFSSDLKFIMQAVDSSVFLIRQDYTLIDKDGNEYGRNSDAFFGKKYALGVLTDSGLYTTGDILSPWENDRNFDKFKNSDSLKPHLSKIYFKQANDRTFEKSDSGQFSTTADTSVIVSPIPGSRPAIASSAGLDTAGWLVLANNNQADIMDDSAVLSLTILKPVIVTEPSGKMYIRNLSAKDDLLGGIFYTSQISLGKILFAAAGILKKDNMGWFIQPFATKSAPAKTDDNMLNPVKKGASAKVKRGDKHKTQ